MELLPPLPSPSPSKRPFPTRHGRPQERVWALPQAASPLQLQEQRNLHISIKEPRRNLPSSIQERSQPNPAIKAEPIWFMETRLLCEHACAGRLQDARKVFDGMRDRDLVAWSAIIAAYAHRLMYDEVVVLGAAMFYEGALPDRFLITRILQACAYVKHLELGRVLHSFVVRSGFLARVDDAPVGNAVLMMYVKCGKLQSARQFFEKMGIRNLGTWNSMIFGHCQFGEHEEALRLLDGMRSEGIEPEVVTWNTLISSYAKSGDVEVAMELLEQMEEAGVVPDVITWTSLISGFVYHDRGDKALGVFRQMRLAGVEPNGMTIAAAISACATLKSLSRGRELHCHAIKVGSVNNVLSGNSLVHMYAKCGETMDAKRVFDEIPEKDIFSWNSMVAGYAQAGYCGKAYELFSKMESYGVRRNVITWNAMISGYIQHGDDDRAFELFQIMEDHGVKRNIASWNALIAGSLWNGHVDRALRIFRKMQFIPVMPNYITILSMLPDCASLVSAWKVREIHARVLRCDLEFDNLIANALIDSYSKSGNLASARAVFDGISSKDLISWNSMIASCALHGAPDDVLDLFHQMKQEGMQPDNVTMASVIKAYGLMGMVSEGTNLFASMAEDYNLTADLDHYAAIVGLLGRSGKLQEAFELIEEMPVIPNSTVWEALLTAARIHGNVGLAYIAARELSWIEPGDPRIQRLLSCIADLNGKSVDVSKGEKPINFDETGSCCWTEIRNKVYSFSTGTNVGLGPVWSSWDWAKSDPILEENRVSRTMSCSFPLRIQPHPGHPKAALEHIVAELELMMIQIGLTALDIGEGALDIEDEKEAVTGIHCEKLAIAFSISNSPHFRSIRIMKTLRTCNHCHTFAKLVSEKYGRRILIKDSKCLHKFEGGKCSCGDYW